jgi:hypothetical protein
VPDYLALRAEEGCHMQIEKTLFEAADKMRGAMDAGE